MLDEYTMALSTVKHNQHIFMSRTLCKQCNRPSKACICDFITSIENTIPVVVLQHPKEVNHTKGTIALLANSLSNCQTIVGEDFSDNDILNEILATFNPLLLYPSDQAEIVPILTAQQLSENEEPSHKFLKECAFKENKKTCLLILDGTWKKAYRMLMLSKNLQSIIHVCLPEKLANSGQYLIRKVAKANALSSLEATCYALALLDSNANKQPFSQALGLYQPLLDKFADFNQFQLSFRPQ